MEKMSMSIEDYLEAIVMLGGTTQQAVRSVDVARELEVSKASVNKAVATLKTRGLLDQPFYGDITLTEDGFEYGQAVLERHHLLAIFLTDVLGIPKERAEEEACKMEHAISDESFENWKAYIKKVTRKADVADKASCVAGKADVATASGSDAAGKAGVAAASEEAAAFEVDGAGVSGGAATPGEHAEEAKAGNVSKLNAEGERAGEKAKAFKASAASAKKVTQSNGSGK